MSELTEIITKSTEEIGIYLESVREDKFVSDVSALMDEIKTLRDALTGIRDRAKDHFCFCEEPFNRRDIDLLAKIGGDDCDWTMTAIEADDALNGKKT